MRPRNLRWAKQLDVIHLRIALSVEGLADAPSEVRQRFDLGQLEGTPMLFHQIKPVPAPGHITAERPELRDADPRVLGLPIAGHIFHRHTAVLVQLGSYDPDASFNAMDAGAQPPQMSQSDNQSDGAVAAHLKRANVVEEDHPGRTGR